MNQKKQELAAVAAREARFWDSLGWPYLIVRKLISRAIGGFDRFQEMSLYYEPAGKRVLEYGCGKGSATFELIERGASSVASFDVSPESIAVANAEAQRRGFGSKVRYSVADAHDLPYGDDEFDLVVGRGILHHLDLAIALAEIRRVLRPGGIAVFAEPLAHHPLLRLGRRLTPMARTDDEHPLTSEDLAFCARIFPRFEHHEIEMLSIPLMPLNLVLPRRLQLALARAVRRADIAVMDRFPGVRRYARYCFLVLPNEEGVSASAQSR